MQSKSSNVTAAELMGVLQLASLCPLGAATVPTAAAANADGYQLFHKEPAQTSAHVSSVCVCVCVSLCLLCFTESWKSVRVCVGKKNSLEEWLRAAAAASFTVSHSLRRDPHTKWLKQRVNWEMHSRWFHIFPWIPASWNLCNYRVESHSDTRRCYKGDLVLQPHFHFFTQHLTCTVRSTLSLTDSNKAKRHNTR